MYRFKDDKEITVMHFVKARCDGQIVRMYATAEAMDAYRKLREYQNQGFLVSFSVKPIKRINNDNTVCVNAFRKRVRND